MTASSLPSGFLLRPAKATDKPIIGKLLTRLQQEIMPVLRLQLIGMGVGVGLVAIGSCWVLGIKSLSYWFFYLLAVGMVVWLILKVLKLKEWGNFWVIEHHGSLVACAKLCQYETYSILYDLFVLPEWRKRGLGSHLVRHLGQRATKPLYLGCLPATVLFYTRLGFAPVPPKKLPLIVRHDLGIPNRFGIVPLVLR